MGRQKKIFVHLDSGRGYSRDLLQGIYAYNNQVSHWEIIFEPAYFLKTGHVKNDMSIINAVQPDGCILEFSENIPTLRKLGIPIVQVTSVNHFRDLPYVQGNYESDGRLAAGYFNRKGFSNLAFFGIEKLDWSVARHAYFKQYAEAFGAHCSAYFLKGNKSDVLSHNFNKLVHWLKQLPKPTGILCCNDNFGQILINACSMAALKVPHDIAVLGIDNDELICNITYPNLSSIARNHFKTAATVCSTLQQLMHGQPPSSSVILTEAVEIIERTSTDTIAAHDEEVAKAIHFISTNLHKPINATDITAATSCSLKALTQKFKQATGHTIHEEIQHRKLSRFKQLLKAGRSIKEIAFELGFQDHSHISRWFTNLEGMPPLEWKKKYITF